MSSLVTVGETPLRVSPPDNRQFVDAREVGLAAAGTESNVAITAACLGADSVWASRLPATQLGRRVVAEIREYGVDPDVTWAQEGRVGLEFTQRGVPPREPIVIQDRIEATAASMTPSDLPMERVQAADGTFVSGSTAALSSITIDTLVAVLGAGRADGGLTVFDLDYRPRLWDAEEARESLTDVFEATDVLIANEDQLRTVFGRTGDPHQVAHGVASQWDFEMLAMTRGEHGALVIHDSVLHECESIDTETVDAAGQHAAFVGAFVRTLLEDEGPDSALYDGVAAATVARTLPGPIPAVDPDDVQDVRAKL
ncbi:sugar kinase [Halorhabdus amylolytica]|uniref:sugar kinase n=1 Tax=Halorhabdus amylolytica TaxID=2559573 RepID=UPI0010AA1D15|nr:sugar kinase [Halorhabdus amylolytica]